MTSRDRSRCTRGGHRALLAAALLALCVIGACLAMPDAADADDSHVDHAVSLSDKGGPIDSGDYYLSDDVTLEADITISGEVTLCLNGNVLTGTGGGSVITIEDGGTLYLYDCGTEERDYHVDDDGLYVLCETVSFVCISSHSDEGIGTIAGGVITGGTGTVDQESREGGGVYVADGGTLIMYGGTISGNEAYFGGGVYVADGGNLIMYDGAISGNTASGANYGYGGGVSVFGGTFIMYDGAISGNTASGVYDGYGGGVCLVGGRFTMSGGEISGNAADYGAGVYAMSSSVELSGNAEITNNVADTGGGVYVYGRTITMYGGTISGNTASSTYGDELYVYSNSRLVMYGGTLGSVSSTLHNIGEIHYKGGKLYAHSISGYGYIYLFATEYTGCELSLGTLTNQSLYVEPTLSVSAADVAYGETSVTVTVTAALPYYFTSSHWSDYISDLEDQKVPDTEVVGLTDSDGVDVEISSPVEWTGSWSLGKSSVAYTWTATIETVDPLELGSYSIGVSVTLPTVDGYDYPNYLFSSEESNVYYEKYESTLSSTFECRASTAGTLTASGYLIAAVVAAVAVAIILAWAFHERRKREGPRAEPSPDDL